MGTFLFIGRATGAISSSLFIDKWGRLNIIKLSGIAVFITEVLASFVTNYTYLLVTLFLFGFSLALSYPQFGLIAAEIKGDSLFINFITHKVSNF